jgi:hypothetical protein
MYAKLSTSRTELVSGIRDTADEIRNDEEMEMGAVVSIVERAQLCVSNQGGHFENVRRT